MTLVSTISFRDDVGVTQPSPRISRPSNTTYLNTRADKNAKRPGHRSGRQTSVTFPLADVEHEGRWVNLFFGAINIAIMLGLVTLGVALLIMAVAPSGMTSAVTNHKGPLSWLSRLLLFLGASCSLGTVKLIGKRFEDVWHWSRLHTSGELIVNDLGIAISHDAVLTTHVLLPWNRIQVIAFDDGHNHDTATHWRRFPVSPEQHPRQFLFATDGDPVLKSALIASRPTAPNMVIVLKDTVVLHNPNTDAIDAAFPIEATNGMPARPPQERSDARILFLRTFDPGEVRRTVSISGKVHPLHKSDLPGLF